MHNRLGTTAAMAASVMVLALACRAGLAQVGPRYAIQIKAPPQSQLLSQQGRIAPAGNGLALIRYQGLTLLVVDADADAYTAEAVRHWPAADLMVLTPASPGRYSGLAPLASLHGLGVVLPEASGELAVPGAGHDKELEQEPGQEQTKGHEKGPGQEQGARQKQGQGTQQGQGMRQGQGMQQAQGMQQGQGTEQAQGTQQRQGTEQEQGTEQAQGMQQGHGQVPGRGQGPRWYPLHIWDALHLRQGKTSLRITAMPGAVPGGPGAGQVAGFVMELGDGRASYRIYLSCTPLADDAALTLPDRLPGADLALAPAPGGFRLLPLRSVRAARRVPPARQLQRAAAPPPTAVRTPSAAALTSSAAALTPSAAMLTPSAAALTPSAAALASSAAALTPSAAALTSSAAALTSSTAALPPSAAAPVPSVAAPTSAAALTPAGYTFTALRR